MKELIIITAIVIATMLIWVGVNIYRRHKIYDNLCDKTKARHTISNRDKQHNQKTTTYE